MSERENVSFRSSLGFLKRPFLHRVVVSDSSFVHFTCVSFLSGRIYLLEIFFNTKLYDSVCLGKPVLGIIKNCL